MPLNTQKIYDSLQNSRQSSTVDLSRRVGLSESTVRRALLDLEKRKLIGRFHGGAYILGPRDEEPPALKRAANNQGAKERIAREAVNLVSPGDCILLTGGSTVACMCAYLKGMPELTVITDSLMVVNQLMYDEAVKLIVLGGVLNVREQCLEGFASMNIKRLRFNKMFHGIKSVSARDGFLTDDVRQVEFYRECAQMANKLVILAAGDKFFREGVSPLFGPAEVDTLITDGGAPPEMVARLQEQGCNVMIAGNEA